MKSSGIDLIAKLLTVFTGCMALLVVAITVMMLQESCESPTRPPIIDDEGSPPPIECDLSRPDGTDCPRGAVCLQNKCESVASPRVCSEGEGCDDCECDVGLICQSSRCERKGKVPAECRAPAVQKAVQRLQRQCEERKDGLSRGACSADEWMAIAFKDPEFFEILSVFKHRFTVHFPENIPSRGRELSKRDRGHFIAEIGHLKKTLTAAKQIFIISRASPDGVPALNSALAQARMDVVYQIVTEVVQQGVPRSEWQPLPVFPWPLDSTKWVSPREFNAKFREPTFKMEHEISPIIAPVGRTPRIEELLDKAAQPGGVLDDGESKELIPELNRMVLVVPILCDGATSTVEAGR